MKKLLLVLFTTLVALSLASAATVRVFENGTGEVTVAASEKVAVFTQGTAKVYKKVGSPNIPGSFTLLATVKGREYTSDAVTASTLFRIEADAEGAWYSTDATPDVQWSGPSVQMKSQRAPTAKAAAVTLTVEELMGGIIEATQATGSTNAYTLPLGTSMDASSDAGSFAIGDSFEWSLINLSAAAADTITVTANTGHTIVGAPIVQAAHASTGLLHGNAVLFRTRKTAANTFVTYRIGG